MSNPPVSTADLIGRATQSAVTDLAGRLPDDARFFLEVAKGHLELAASAVRAAKRENEKDAAA